MNHPPSTTHPFQQSIQIRWNDLDALGHVNNAVFITYFEMARGPYMLAASSTWDWATHMFLIGRVEASFQRELTFRDRDPRVEVRTTRLGGKSFDIAYRVLSTGPDGDEVVHATGTTTQVMFDTATRTTIPIPDWLRGDLEAFEGGVGA